MSYNDAIERTWRDNILFSALVELTYRCNLDCFICYNDTDLAGAPLTSAEYVRFFEDLRDLGTLNLTLTGGEPLAHPDFFTLGREARRMGFVVRVKSNAHALRGRLAQRMKDEVDPFTIEVSVHGASPQTHDRQTRVPGSFARLIANIRESQALGLRFRVNAPLTVWNEHEIEAMFALVDELGVPFTCDPEITRRDNGDTGPFAVAPSAAGVARLHDVQRRRAAASCQDPVSAQPEPATAASDAPASPDSRKHCGAGSSSITVDPYGNVYPCVQWRRRIGNLHEQSIGALWRHSAELDDVRGLTMAVRTMVDAQASPGFSFCPGSAERETGSALGIYPAAQVLLDLRKRAPGTR